MSTAIALPALAKHSYCSGGDIVVLYLQIDCPIAKRSAGADSERIARFDDLLATWKRSSTPSIAGIWACKAVKWKVKMGL